MDDYPGRQEWNRLRAAVLCLVLGGFPLVAQEADVDLRDLSFEELLDVQVTSASKKSESVADTAAAVTVITQEDIRRSGALNLAEAIRLAPGVQVAAIDSANWAISSRGFNDLFANKLLVMIDGRPVYTPMFSGVYWDVQDTIMDDIDRIEIIKGPGAALWGANAVNGIINVISKSAQDTQGIFTYGTLGTEHLGEFGFRYGFQPADDLYVRLYGKYQERDSFRLPSGRDSSDRYELGQGGFRLDWLPDAQSEWTLQGDLYGGASSFLADAFVTTPPFAGTALRTPNVRGGNILGRYTRHFANTGPFSLQIFYDRYHRDSDFLQESRGTFDIDVQYRLPVSESVEFIVGGNYRNSQDRVTGPSGAALLPALDGLVPPRETLELRSGFVQAEWELVPEVLKFTAGSKFEDNDYTGMEIQPSTRLSWHPEKNQTVWAAVSRAVRTPSRAERAIQFTQIDRTLPAGVSFFGSDDYDAEDLLAYELGYRIQASPRLSIDVATFFNDYAELQTREFGFPFFGGGLPVIPVTADNLMDAESYGGELSLNWRISDSWRLRPSYSYLQIEAHQDSASTDLFAENIEGSSPRHSASLWSYWEVTPEIEFDVGLRYVDSLPDLNVPGYFVGDVRLGWQVNESVYVSVGGKNLFDSQHPEFPPTLFFLEEAQVQHSGYVRVSVSF